MDREFSESVLKMKFAEMKELVHIIVFKHGDKLPITAELYKSLPAIRPFLTTVYIIVDYCIRAGTDEESAVVLVRGMLARMVPGKEAPSTLPDLIHEAWTVTMMGKKMQEEMVSIPTPIPFQGFENLPPQ